MTRKRKPSGHERPFEKGRSAAEYVRRSPYLRQKRLILAVCESKETEPNYFNSLYRSRDPVEVRVHVLRGGEAKALPAKVVERARKAKVEWSRDYWNSKQDQVWCVFDTERAGTYPELLALARLAKRHGLHLAVSHPAFEYWFLLHFEASVRPFPTAQDVIDALHRHLPQYAKNMDAFARLEDLTQQALTNAQALRDKSDDDWESFPCPSTGVDLLVREILR